MKRLRLLLIVLMSWVIPLNGFAATSLSVCPMQAQDSAGAISTDEMSAMSAAIPDCCLELDDQSSFPNPCKPGQACSVGWLFFSLPSSLHIFPAISRTVLTHFTQSLLNGQSTAIWHPPRQS